MASELERIAGYFDRRSSLDMEYSQYMEKQASMLNNINTAINYNTDRIKDSITHLQNGINESIQDQTFSIVSSQNNLQRALSSSINNLNNSVDIGFSQISDKLGYMTASFFLGFARLEDVTIKMSADICSKLDAIHDILNNKLLYESRELFRRAIDEYKNGFFDDALEDIVKAIEKYKADYLSWFLKGKILTFGAGEFCNVINLKEAIYAFTQAIKYNSPNIAKSKEAELLSSEIYFYLGTAQYSRSNELFRINNTEAMEILCKALNSFEQSFKYSNKMFESLFNVIRCKVLLNRNEEALIDLEKLVLLDRNYCLKIYDDKDFSIIYNDFADIINKLKKQYFLNEAEPRYKNIINYILELKNIGVDYVNIKMIPKKFTDELPYFDIIEYNEDFKELILDIKEEIQKYKKQKR